MRSMLTWLRGLARNLRDGGIGSAAGYLGCSSIRTDLPKLVRSLTAERHFEIHALVGAPRIDMALWMAASWMLATQCRWKFVFHDDGTLTQSNAADIRGAVPGARVILSAESSREMHEALANYPAAWKCRNLHPLCRKLFDIPHFAQGTKFITIDTDILFFRKPVRLLRWINSDETTAIFLKDVSDATLPSAVAAAKAVGCVVKRSINTGIVAMTRSAITVKEVDQCLRQTNIATEDPWFIEQSLYALLASLEGNVELLGEDYYMPVTGCVPADATARHYMGKIRHCFYTEGLSQVRALAENAKI